ncbi:MAG: adenylate kinase [Acidobacteriales bacterium]|nr:adenylate kinase [Terriglobales bacterium]
MKPIALILLGPPGSGKGTVAKSLSAHFAIPHVSTGDILRENVKAGTELGKEVKAVMDAGKLVSDQLVNRVVEDRLARPDCAKGVILDGYPRTIEQAKVLDGVLAKAALETVILYITVDYEVIVRRLGARRSCPVCGAVYNLISKAPKKAGVCDVEGAELITRNDDKEDVIRKRLVAYDEQTQPLVDFYRARVKRFREVVGGETTTPEENAASAIRAVEQE